MHQYTRLECISTLDGISILDCIIMLDCISILDFITILDCISILVETSIYWSIYCQAQSVDIHVVTARNIMVLH